MEQWGTPFLRNSSELVRLALETCILYNFFNPSNGNSTNASKTSGQACAFVTTDHLTQSHFHFGTVHLLQHESNIQGFLPFARFQTNSPTMVSSFNFFYLHYIDAFARTAT